MQGFNSCALGRETWLNIAALIRAAYDGATPNAVRFALGSLLVTHFNPGTTPFDGYHVLCVQGSDDWQDWAKNLTYGKTYADLVPGSTGMYYYKGFLTDAKLVFSYASGILAASAVPVLLTGHSRGAAIAAIVGGSLALPTYVIASPRPASTRVAKTLPGEKGVLVLNRRDDAVANLPMASLGFRHIGAVCWARPASRHRGEDHRIAHYIECLEDPGTQYEGECNAGIG